MTRADWIMHRNPGLPDLRVTFKKPGYEHYGGEFLASDGESIYIDTFEKPPKGCGYYPGYWRCAGTIAWMYLPGLPEKKVEAS